VVKVRKPDNAKLGTDESRVLGLMEEIAGHTAVARIDGSQRVHTGEDDSRRISRFWDETAMVRLLCQVGDESTIHRDVHVVIIIGRREKRP
jgi:hypothetical protein